MALGPRSSIGAALTTFLDHLNHERRLSPLTVRNYHHSLWLFTQFARDSGPQAETVADLAQWRAQDFRGFLAHRHDAGVSAASMRLDLSALRTFAAFIHRRTGTSWHGLDRLRAPKLPKRVPRPVGAFEASRLTDPAFLEQALGGPEWLARRDAALFSVLYGAGLRIGEALGLNWADIPSTDQVLRVTGKGNKVRRVPILPAVADALDLYRIAAEAFGPPRADHGADDPVFIGLHGQRLHPGTAQARLRKLRPVLGLDDSATPHALRHAFATHMLGAGADLRAIQELMGHASLASTQVYTDVDADRLVRAHKQSHPRARLARK